MTTIAYNRRSIMQEAWSFQVPGKFNARMFARDLRQAWHNAKRRIQMALQSDADRTREAIEMLENKDTWSQEDYARMGVLRAALRAKVEHEQADAFAAKRDIIQSAPACTVTFRKTDGTSRVMRVRARETRNHVKGDRATPAGRTASHTRAFRHAHLLPVWDDEAKAIRSVNLSTVSRIVTPTETHSF